MFFVRTSNLCSVAVDYRVTAVASVPHTNTEHASTCTHTYMHSHAHTHMCARAHTYTPRMHTMHAQNLAPFIILPSSCLSHLHSLSPKACTYRLKTSLHRYSTEGSGEGGVEGEGSAEGGGEGEGREGGGEKGAGVNLMDIESCALCLSEDHQWDPRWVMAACGVHSARHMTALPPTGWSHDIPPRPRDGHMTSPPCAGHMMPPPPRAGHMTAPPAVWERPTFHARPGRSRPELNT